MKRSINCMIVLVSLLLIGIVSVKAESYYFVNDNGVTFTKNEYDFITEMYYDGYQAYMTEEDKAVFNGVKMVPGNVETVEYEDKDTFVPGVISPKATSHETASKILRISKTGSNNPVIAISCSWKKSPNVRSYDLIGAYLNGVSKTSGVVSRITYSGGTINPSAIKNPNNGHGAVIKLPSGGNSIVASTTFSVTTGGKVYGSYQHAASSISLANANSYTIASSGLGHVFKFSNTSISNKYDGMSGVYINV